MTLRATGASFGGQLWTNNWEGSVGPHGWKATWEHDEHTSATTVAFAHQPRRERNVAGQRSRDNTAQQREKGRKIGSPAPVLCDKRKDREDTYTTLARWKQHSWRMSSEMQAFPDACVRKIRVIEEQDAPGVSPVQSCTLYCFAVRNLSVVLVRTVHSQQYLIVVYSVTIGQNNMHYLTNNIYYWTNNNNHVPDLPLGGVGRRGEGES